MQIETIIYQDGSEILKGKLVRSKRAADNQPAILLFHAFEGLSEFTLDYAQKLAEKGYAVFAADMYGQGAVAHTIEDCFKLITPFLQDRALVRRRALLAYQTLLQQSGVDTAHIGVMGFCFGGMCMLELARSGAKFQAGVSAHGVLAAANLVTEKIQPALLILHGYADPQVPPTVIGPFAQEMDTAGVKDWSVVFFGPAQHSFTDPATGTYDPVKEKEMGRAYDPIAAARTFRYAVDFFSEKLQGV